MGAAMPGVGRVSSTGGAAATGAAGADSSRGAASGLAGAVGLAAGASATVAGTSWVSSVAAISGSVSGSRSGTSNPYSRRSLMATSSSMELEWVFFSVHAQFREPVENLVSFDFQLPRQLVDSNLLHRKSYLSLPPRRSFHATGPRSGLLAATFGVPSSSPVPSGAVPSDGL